MASKPISINGQKFPSKAALKTYIRSIVSRYIDNEILGDVDFQFVRSLLDLHRWRDEKIGVGVASMMIRKSDYRNREFWLTRMDGTATDFSWVECVDHPSQRKDVFTAMRTAIAPQKASFRARFFASNSDPKCPMTEEPLESATCHVDHVPPLTFDKLANDFIVEQGIDLEAVSLSGYGDGETAKVLADENLRLAWQEYHLRNAQLRILSSRGNLSVARKS